MQTLKKVKYKEWNCLLQRGHYGNGRVALCLIDADDGEPVATCTVNLPDEPLDDGEVFIKDYAENLGMTQFLVKEGVVQLTGRTVRLPYESIPVCKLLIGVENGVEQ